MKCYRSWHRREPVLGIAGPTAVSCQALNTAARHYQPEPSVRSLSLYHSRLCVTRSPNKTRPARSQGTSSSQCSAAPPFHSRQLSGQTGWHLRARHRLSPAPSVGPQPQQLPGPLPYRSQSRPPALSPSLTTASYRRCCDRHRSAMLRRPGRLRLSASVARPDKLASNQLNPCAANCDACCLLQRSPLAAIPPDGSWARVLNIYVAVYYIYSSLVVLVSIVFLSSNIHTTLPVLLVSIAISKLLCDCVNYLVFLAVSVPHE